MTLLGTTTLALRVTLGATALAGLAACSSGSDTAAPAGDSTSTSPSASTATGGASPSESASDTPTASPPDAPSESASTPPAPTATPTTKPRLITYAGGESPGVVVHQRADAHDLTGSPNAFKRFIGDTAQRITDTADCDAAAKGVTVQAVRTDGYAVGGVNECGGYAAIWADVDGGWKEILGTQDSWECKVLERYTVPSDIAGTTCYDYDAQQEHDYRQR